MRVKVKIFLKGLLIFVYCIGIVFTCIYVNYFANNGSSNSFSSSSSNTSFNTNEKFEIDNKSRFIVGQKFDDLGYVDRNIPSSVNSEGLSRYPTYGTSLVNITDEEKDALINECNVLLANNGSYDSLDEKGNYLLNGELTGRKLYKHVASVGMYEGNVSDEEKAIIRKISINPLIDRNYLTGLYIPAGEIAKLEISNEDLTSIGSLTVYVGQVGHRNTINNIWKARNDFSRMPVIVNTLKVTSSITYLGNPFGGPIFIYPEKKEKFEVTISGAIEYPCYIHGYTTEEDLNRMKNLSTPYYDFEVWYKGVRHSGVKSRGNFDYENLVKVGNLWENICLTSNQLPAYYSKDIGISYMYDSFVAAGEAVAFVGGRMAVNAPLYWESSALNYENITKNGMWGTIHEYNHHFQCYGMEGSSVNEITNNASSLLSYILYTDISSSRSEDDSTLSGWNRYLDPSRSLKETISKTSKQNGLNTYADLIHSFGVSKFIEMANLGNKIYTVDTWFDAVCKATNYDMSYYFEKMLFQEVSEEMKNKYSNLPLFIPVASLYQSGRSYISDNQEVFSNTVKPYQFDKNLDCILDFEKNIVVPNGFTYKINNVSSPKNGTLEKINDLKYQYYFDENNESGDFYVSLSLTNNEITIDDVKLLIDLKVKDPLPEKTMYTYSSRVYSLPDEALKNNFVNYIEKETTYVKSTFMNHISNNKIGYLNGKIYIDQDGEYTICLRAGRGNHALYTSLDGVNYTKQIEFSGDKGGFEVGNDHTFNIKLKKGDFLYYKQITISNNHPDAFTELGWSINDNNVKAISSNYLYGVNSTYKINSFTYDEVYQRNNLLNYSYQNDINKQKIVSINQDSWDETTKKENILDGNENTFYHSSQNDKLTEDNPFEMMMDLGENRYWNTITFIGRKTGINHLPITFTLYAGETEDNLIEINSYENLTPQGINLTIKFKSTKFQYFKIHVTNTSSSNPNKYVCLSRVNVFYNIEGNTYSCDQFDYYNNWTLKNDKFSLFNHYLSGNGYLEFSLEKVKTLMIFALQDNYCKIKITLNNEEYYVELDKNSEFIFVKEFNEETNFSLKIEVLEGYLNLDNYLIN